MSRRRAIGAPARATRRGRAASSGCVAALVCLWPLLVLAEFKPWLLFDPRACSPTLRFLAGFLPPRARRRRFSAWWRGRPGARSPSPPPAWRWRWSSPCRLRLLSMRVLSVSGLAGPHGRAAGRAAVGACAALLIVLRSVPELVWALVFVRVVGLGPTAGVLAIALTYGGMLGKVYGEILESGDAHSAARCCAMARAACRPSSTACCLPTPPSSPATRCTAGNARSAPRPCWVSSAPAGWASRWTSR